MFVALCREEGVKVSGAATTSSMTEARPAEPAPTPTPAPAPSAEGYDPRSSPIASGGIIRGVRSFAQAGVAAGMLPEVRPFRCKFHEVYLNLRLEILNSASNFFNLNFSVV